MVRVRAVMIVTTKLRNGVIFAIWAPASAGIQSAENLTHASGCNACHGRLQASAKVVCQSFRSFMGQYWHTWDAFNVLLLVLVRERK